MLRLLSSMFVHPQCFAFLRLLPLFPSDWSVLRVINADMIGEIARPIPMDLNPPYLLHAGQASWVPSSMFGIPPIPGEVLDASTMRLRYH